MNLLKCIEQCRQWAVLVPWCSATFFSLCCVEMQPPEVSGWHSRGEESLVSSDVVFFWCFFFAPYVV